MIGHLEVGSVFIVLYACVLMHLTFLLSANAFNISGHTMT